MLFILGLAGFFWGMVYFLFPSLYLRRKKPAPIDAMFNLREKCKRLNDKQFVRWVVAMRLMVAGGIFAAIGARFVEFGS